VTTVGRGGELDGMTERLDPTPEGERAQSVWMFDIETGSDGAPLDFRLRDVQIARPGGLPLHPGELVSMWDRDLDLGAGEHLLAVMQRVVAEGGVVERLVALPGTVAHHTRVRVLALGGMVLVTCEEATLQLDGFFDNALDMLCIAGFDGRFRRLNPTWSEVLGWSTEELTGRAYLELVHPDDRERTIAETARLADGQNTFAFENRYLAIDGSYRVLSWRSVPSVEYGVVFACARDITELRRTEQALRDADAEKDTLLKEIHHRVKNNLQVISSLLKLRADTLTSAEARHALQDSQDRVRSIALLHEKLYRSTDLGSIDLGEYAEGLFTTLLRTYRLEPAPALVLESRALQLELDAAMPVGLILNELMTNALKHAFTSSPRPPRLEVTMREEAGWIEIEFADNGVGYPHDPDGRPTATLGMELVHTLATQVGGAVTLFNHDGARCQLRFPRDQDVED